MQKNKAQIAGSENTDRNNLTEGPIFTGILWFTLPFLFSNLLQTLYGTVDTLVIGKFGSSSGVSAVACGSQLLSMFTFLAIGLSAGGTVLVGQCIGSRDHKRGVKIIGNLIIDFAAIGLFLTVVALLFSTVFLSWLNVPAEAMAEAVAYMRICSFGIPLIIGYNIVCALLRAMGDSKSPLIFVAVACVINIIGDVVLTGMLRMGVVGVAISTVAAQSIGFLFSLAFITRRGMSFPFSRRDIRFDWQITTRIFQIGIPMGIQSVLINISFMFITAIINSMGLTASAAMGIGDKIVSFTFMPQSAFSASVAVVVAQNYGAGKYARIRKGIRQTLAMAYGSVGVCTLFIFLTGKFILTLITKGESQELIDNGAEVLLEKAEDLLTLLDLK